MENNETPETTEATPVVVAPVYDATAKIIIQDRSEFPYKEVETDAYNISADLANLKSLRKSNVEWYAKKDKVRDYLIENYEDIEEHAVEIAEILEIELTRTYDIIVTVSHSFSVEVGVGEDEPDESDFSFEVSSYRHDVGWADTNVDDFSADES